MKQENLLPQVQQLFAEYLELNHQRKTTERFAILTEIYSRNDHFDAESLFLEMKKKHYNVSRATVYNTLDLLQECALITRHQFGNNQARFEKSYGFRQHDHLICLDCHKVLEFCDPRIHQITTRMGDLLNFEIDHHSLILYGHCRGCDAKDNLQHTKQKKDAAARQGKRKPFVKNQLA
ncbi:MAG: transcriptional repressor [Chitinophagales bacterium]|nr:transcriptional repressor [Chitinophagales bacterium]